MPSRFISGVDNMFVYVGGAAAFYYFFIYETDEAKAKRLQKEAVAKQRRSGY